MYVVATAGHVDHGKSALVRALTGIEPDRWDEEKRRGLTIDLGFAWTSLDSGRDVAFVDVPGHERFLGNMLAGLGPAPVVMLVVAADEGWRAQSSDHRDAIAALGIERGLVVLSRSDLMAGDAAEVREQVRRELAKTGLRDAPVVVASALTGDGLEEVRTRLDGVLADLPAPVTSGRVRFWVDRSFTISGAGTVVTGTLTAGTIAVGDQFDVLTEGGVLRAAVRGLQTRGESVESATPVTRLALNLRGVAADDIRRGDPLVTPSGWLSTSQFDVRRSAGLSYRELPDQLTVHVGTAAVPARLRALDEQTARLTLARPLPIVAGDRIVLRDPGAHLIAGGAVVVDAEPPPLVRRGDAARRASAIDDALEHGDVVADVERRGAVQARHLRQLGLIEDGATPPDGVLAIDKWWVARTMFDRWSTQLGELVAARYDADPMGPGVSRGAAVDELGLPDAQVLDALAATAQVERSGGYLRKPGTADALGAAETAIVELERRLREAPFRAPEAHDLKELSLTPRALAAAERAGRVLRLPDGVVLLPEAPALAMRELAALDQPFTTSQARQALDTTRRVAIPLLEHLDSRGWTRRLDAGHREVVR